MKRTSLTTAVIAGLAGVAGISNMASAVYLNQDGLGQVLVYPYYTVNNNNITLMTVVNTTNQAKAIKVRYLEAYDSREVLDFNLYMSKFDVWTAAVVPSGAGAGVFTTDNSCTVPGLPRTAAGAQPFSTGAFDGTVLANDGGPSNVQRTLEGYVELIEMGVVTGNSAGYVTHNNGLPPGCATVYNAWNGGYWDPSAGGNSTTDITYASGGLFGSGAIVNVGAGQIAGYNADAIDQWLSSSSNHSAPGSLAPSIAGGNSKVSYVFASTPGFTNTQLIVTQYGLSIDAVSSVFMADKVYNEYWTGGGTAANSEWVVTFPTKRFYVDPNGVGTSVGSDPAQAGVAPFEVKFSSANGGTSCAKIGLAVYDREERVKGGSIGFSPGTPRGTSLCWEAQVVTFNQALATPNGPSAILGSNMSMNIDAKSAGASFGAGWAVIDLYNKIHALPSAYTSSQNNAYLGLPVTGFWVTNLVNGNVGGVLSNYSALFRHKFHRTCVYDSGASGTTGINTSSGCSLLPPAPPLN